MTWKHPSILALTRISMLETWELPSGSLLFSRPSLGNSRTTIISASSMYVKYIHLSFTRSCQPLRMCSDFGNLHPQSVCIYKPNSRITCCLQLFTYFSEGV